MISPPDRPSGLEWLLIELESNALTVVLIPCRHGSDPWAMRRVCATKNARWYAAYCANHGSSRKRRNSAHDTCIKRAETILLLSRLIAGRPVKSKYADELREFARRAERRIAA